MFEPDLAILFRHYPRIQPRKSEWVDIQLVMRNIFTLWNRIIGDHLRPLGILLASFDPILGRHHLKGRILIREDSKNNMS